MPWWERWQYNETAAYIIFFSIMFVGMAVIFGVLLYTANPESRCTENDDSSACLNWGRSVERSGDLQEAERIYAMGCDLDNGKACRNQGMMAVRRDDLEAAIPPLEKGCRLETERTCSNLAYFASDIDPGLAMWAGERSCELGNPLGCANYAYQFLKRYVDGEEIDSDDLRETLRYARRGCRGGSESGCYRLALAELYMKDVSAAQRAAMQAIDLNDSHPHTHKTLGLTLVLDGDVDDAMNSFADAANAEANPGGRERYISERPVEERIARRLESLRSYHPGSEAFIEEAISRLE